MLAPARDLAAAAAAGELLNLYSLPYFDLSADYMTKPLATDGVIHNTCYAVYGSATGRGEFRVGRVLQPNAAVRRGL